LWFNARFGDLWGADSKKLESAKPKVFFVLVMLSLKGGLGVVLAVKVNKVPCYRIAPSWLRF